MITELQTPTRTREPGSVPSADGLARSAAPRPAPRRTTRLRRRIVYAVLALALVALTLLAMRPTPIDVELAAVVRGPLRVTVEADGMTRVRERYTVSAPITGRLARMTLREGESLGAGGVVARLTPVPVDPRTEGQARARVASAQSLLRQAEVRVEEARAASVQAAREAARRRELAAAGALSDEQMEQAALAATLRARELQAAQAGARAAAGEVAAARAALMSASPAAVGSEGVVTVRSPVAGRVLRLPEKSERVIQAGSPLLELGDARGLEVVLDVLSTDAVSLRPGTPMLVTGWGGADTLRGRVRYVEPSAFTKVSALGVEEQRVNVVGDLLAAPPALGDGFRVEAALVLSEAPRALKVPSSALFQADGEWSTFVVREARAYLRRVVPGERGAAETEVVRGLAPGESVVRYPSDKLTDGARVREAPRGG